MRQTCKICGKQLIPSYGPTSSKILIAGEFPGTQEIIRGIPFIGKTGDILKAEATRAGLNILSCRLTNLWQHAKDEENCDVEWHIQQLVREMRGKTHILLMGSDLTYHLLGGKSVMDLTGMEVKSDMFPKQRIFVSVNPAFLFHGPVGELRLALGRFVESLDRR